MSARVVAVSETFSELLDRLEREIVQTGYTLLSVPLPLRPEKGRDGCTLLALGWALPRAAIQAELPRTPTF